MIMLLSKNWLKKLMTIFVVVFLLSILAVLARQSFYPAFGNIRDVSVRATLTESFQNISQLNVLKVSMAGIVDGVDESFWGDNKVLIVAQGYANLGVDLSYVNIYVDEKEVQITILEPQVTDAYIDMSQSRIYERELGTFRVDTNGELENLTWQKAHDKMIDMAYDEKNVSMAKTNTVALIRALVSPYIGNRSLTIEFLKNENYIEVIDNEINK